MSQWLKIDAILNSFHRINDCCLLPGLTLQFKISSSVNPVYCSTENCNHFTQETFWVYTYRFKLFVKCIVLALIMFIIVTCLHLNTVMWLFSNVKQQQAV